MSDPTPQLTAERMLRPLEEALRDPDGQEKALDGLLAQINAQEGLPAAARRDAAAALEGQRRTLRQARLAAIAAELRAQLKRFGIAAEFRVLKRQRKSAKAAAAPTTQSSTPSASETNLQPVVEGEPASVVEPKAHSAPGGGGGVFGLGKRGRTGS